MIKKIFYFSIFIIVLFIYNTSFSNWYGNHPVVYGNPGGTALATVHGGGPNRGTWCGSDGDTSGGSHPTLGERAVALNNSSSTLTPHGAQSSIAPSGTLRCLYWDAYVPTGTINYPDIRTNTSQNITYSANDLGGSRLEIVRLERRQITITDTGYSGSWSARATVPGQNYTGLNTNTFTTHTYTQPFNNRIAYQYRVRIWDEAGNTRTYNLPNIIHMENEIPDGSSSNINVDNNANPTHTVSFSGRTNNLNQTVNMFIGDTGGSKINQYILEQKIATDTPLFVTWPAARTTVASGVGVNSNYITPNYNYTAINRHAYRYRLRVEDNAGNWYTFEDANMITKIDTDVTTAGEITTDTLSNLLANNNYQYIETRINRNIGAPISSIKYCFEDFSSVNNWLPQTTNNTPYNDNITYTYFHFPANISNVDNNRVNGARTYSYKIIEVCDEATNCFTGGDCTGGTLVYSDSTMNYKAFDYKIFANTISPSTTFNEMGVSTDDIGGISNVADGTVKNITITLKDRYGNEIVPASGIGRDIDFNFDVNNSLHLDQYTQSGNGVFMSIPNDSTSFNNRLLLTNTTTSFDNQTSSDGIYNFGFRIYTPTWPNYMAEPGGDVIINDITFDIKDTHPDIPASAAYNGASLTGANNIDFDFAPKYEASFAGEIDTYGFIEGSVQNSSINITDNSPGLPALISNDHIYMEFGSGIINELNSDLNMTLSGGTMHYVEEGHTGSITNLSNPLNITSQNIQTLLTQESWATLDSLQHAHLSTHIGYTITNPQLPGGQIDVRYNSDIIGKPNYIGGLSNDNTYQSGLKVLGNTSSKKTHEIMTNQDSNDLHILGNLTKASLRKDLKRKVYMIVRNISPTTNHTIDNLIGNIWDIQYGDNRIYNNKVIYYNTSGNINLGDIGGNEVVEGKKTIIIEGANLYIRSNMSYNNKNTDILGIIVLKNKNGNGGNIYIDPSVTNIVGTLYADKSLISYDGTNELDGDTDQSILNNQLHIYGSVFSENTIGGSRATPFECPYYITLACTREESQKYDLNYLRRYFIYDDDISGPGAGTIELNGTDPVANGGISYIGVTDNYRQYPLVIEYNSLLQSSPPPMFNK